MSEEFESLPGRVHQLYRAIGDFIDGYGEQQTGIVLDALAAVAGELIEKGVPPASRDRMVVAFHHSMAHARHRAGGLNGLSRFADELRRAGLGSVLGLPPS